MKIAVVGYGNLGKSAVKIIENTADMELFGVFSMIFTALLPRFP